jgi:hypothetical protein
MLFSPRTDLISQSLSTLFPGFGWGIRVSELTVADVVAGRQRNSDQPHLATSITNHTSGEEELLLI